MTRPCSSWLCIAGRPREADITDPTIITLSSIPPRFAHLGPTLASLLAQDLPPEQIILYIPHQYRRFPDWTGTLPPIPEGVTLRRAATDHGPATKILPALQDFAGRSVDILFCDDDMFYDSGWHRRFKQLRREHPGSALCDIAHHLPVAGFTRRPRMRRWSPADLAAHLATLPPPLPDPAPLIRESGYADVLEGWGGVMVRPEFFDDRVFDIPSNLWMVDDPWLSGHLTLRDVPIWTNADGLPPRRRCNVGHDIAPLFFEVFDGKARHQSDQDCVEYYRSTYGIWPADPLPVSLPRRMARIVLPHRVRKFALRLLGR